MECSDPRQGARGRSGHPISVLESTFWVNKLIFFSPANQVSVDLTVLHLRVWYHRFRNQFTFKVNICPRNHDSQVNVRHVLLRLFFNPASSYCLQSKPSFVRNNVQRLGRKLVVPLKCRKTINIERTSV